MSESILFFFIKLFLVFTAHTAWCVLGYDVIDIRFGFCELHLVHAQRSVVMEIGFSSKLSSEDFCEGLRPLNISGCIDHDPSTFAPFFVHVI